MKRLFNLAQGSGDGIQYWERKSLLELYLWLTAINDGGEINDG